MVATFVIFKFPNGLLVLGGYGDGQRQIFRLIQVVLAQLRLKRFDRVGKFLRGEELGRLATGFSVTGARGDE